MGEPHNDEIDLGYLLNKFNQALKKGAISLFKLVSFMVKYWIVILCLIVAGVALGYFSEKNKQSEQEATLLLRPNFGTTHFVYEAIALLGKKASQRDSLFLTKHNFRGDIQEILDIQIEPVVDLNDMVRKYNANDRNLETLIENVDFEDGDALKGAFLSHYEYHLVKVSLSFEAKDDIIARIMDYLNSSKLIKEISSTGKQGLEDKINYNTKTIEQIDTIISRYHQYTSSSLTNPKSLVVGNELDMSDVLDVKRNLQISLDVLRQDLVRSKEAIVMVNEPLLVPIAQGFLSNKKVVYPILFVLAFLFLAWMRSSYLYIKKLALEEEIKKND